MLQLILGLEDTFQHDLEELARATHTNYSELRDATERLFYSAEEIRNDLRALTHPGEYQCYPE